MKLKNLKNVEIINKKAQQLVNGGGDKEAHSKSHDALSTCCDAITKDQRNA